MSALTLTPEQLASGGVFTHKTDVPAIAVLSFWREYTPDPADPSQMREAHWVKWAKRGESGQTTSEKVARLMPTAQRQAAAEWQVIGPLYEHWLKGEEAPQNGTALYAWPGMPRELADEFKKLHILTVENLAELPDHALSRIPYPNTREMRARAKAFVDGKELAAYGDQLALRDRQIEAQAGELTDLREQIALLTARLDDATRQQQPAEPAPKGRRSRAAAQDEDLP